MKVYAPNTSFTGRTAGVAFEDGVGEFDPKVEIAAAAYFRRHGFGLGRPARPPEPETVDARHATRARVGEPLRDASVDPDPADFLPPTSAGEADPHGPEVVAPGLHAVPPAPIRPGPVAVDDLPRQSAEETALAQAVLVDQVPVPDALEAITAAAPERPAVRAPAADWRDWAVAQGMDPVEAASTSKEKLIERYGG